MCGITGIIDFNRSVESKTLSAFNHRLIHRGPDAQHTFISANKHAGLGHCRLSILDTSSASDQPFKSADNRYWLTFNGEIYNYLEIKRELLALGHHFNTNSDTEVLLVAFIQWGKDCLQKFNGMWAFAIWDEKTQELFASRDRFGVKSLYFSSQKQRLLLASEQKALFMFRDQGIGHVSPSAAGWIALYPESVESKRETLYSGVEKLLPGEYMIYNRKGLKITQWWNTFEQLRQAPSGPTDADMLHELFEQACLIRTRSDVKIATSLSGGLDSSAVTSKLAQLPHTLGQQALRSFTGSFINSDKDEFKWAQQVTEMYHIPHERVEITAEHAVNSMIEASLAIEDLTSLPILGPWFVYRSMRQHGYKVSVEGHAGDELLGGYTRHLNVYIADIINAKTDSVGLATALIALRDSIGEKNLAKLRGNVLQLSLDPTSTNLNLINGKPYLERLLQGHSGIQDHEVIERNSASFNSHDILFQRLYEDFHYYSLPSILKTYDRLSMANSVEVRSPFLDYRFVLAAFSAPAKFRIYKGENKNLLRQYFSFIPEQIRQRRDKKGFSQPLGDWLGGLLGKWLAEFIEQPRFVQSELYDGVALRNILRQLIRAGKNQQVMMYWPIINLALLEQHQL